MVWFSANPAADSPITTRRPWPSLLTWFRVAGLVVGVATVLVVFGAESLSWQTRLWLECLAVTSAIVLTALAVLDWRLGVSWGLPVRHRQAIAAVALAIAFLIALILTILPDGYLTTLVSFDTRMGGMGALVPWSRLAIIAWAGLGLLDLFRHVSIAGWSPAGVLVGSFFAADCMGTVLLMLPFAQRGPGSADFFTALFTSTSALCVTGLTVENTGTYWSGGGQMVILGLIQVGGLGIMTCGAFFSIFAGRRLLMRETVLLGSLLERKFLADIRRLVLAILIFTVATEAVGAVLLSGLWSDRAPGERIFFSLFHSVSAFCNAGFALAPNSFEGNGERWQVWGVTAGLIIVGGLGFAVLHDVFHRLSRRTGEVVRRRSFARTAAPGRLSLTTRLVLVATLMLLVLGTLGILLLEWNGVLADLPPENRLANAWFQSATSRTAGFQSVAVREMGEASKFLLVLLMFIGASPGSTGGGVKTIPVAVALLTLLAVLRGRERTEVFRRTLGTSQVYRAFLIVVLGMVMVVAMTLVLLVMENRAGSFLDYLFEVSSALATAGLSTGVTPSLSTGGRCLIIVAMFIGRVGPLTLLMALARRTTSEHYRYPDEQVMLG
ncbi:MAG: Trk family potassium uptake protein [Planctomycetes bacterium]|nr:Trk family potassium uptake protein [Planctomycetota bacterium]